MQQHKSTMSLSINDLFNTVQGAKNVYSKMEGLLQNPDIPTPSDFDDLIEIKDKAYSALKLTSQPRNGSTFMLPRMPVELDPRRDNFLMENAIDPNVIRKRIDPDSALPTLESGLSTLFSLEKSNVESNDFVGLIQKAHQSYNNYKNRFAMPPPKEEFKTVYPKMKLMKSTYQVPDLYTTAPTQAGDIVI